MKKLIDDRLCVLIAILIAWLVFMKTYAVNLNRVMGWMYDFTDLFRVEFIAIILIGISLLMCKSSVQKKTCRFFLLAVVLMQIVEAVFPLSLSYRYSYYTYFLFSVESLVFIPGIGTYRLVRLFFP